MTAEIAGRPLTGQVYMTLRRTGAHGVFARKVTNKNPTALDAGDIVVRVSLLVMAEAFAPLDGGTVEIEADSASIAAVGAEPETPVGLVDVELPSTTEADG